MARAAASLLVLLLSAISAAAERLPIRLYSVADGLPHDAINRIVRDSRGFLWFCTADGISIFDGYGFSSFGVADGLPHPAVRDVLETRDGEYWVATSGGVSRFNPRGQHRFTTAIAPGADPLTQRATALLQSQDGTIWVGTVNGLMRLDRTASAIGLVPVAIPGRASASIRGVMTLLEDTHGALWIGTDNGLYRRWRDGAVARYDMRDGLPSALIQDLLQDRHGQLWVATRSAGFFGLAIDASHAPPVVTRRYNSANGYVDWIWDLFERADGRLDIATNLGLYEFRAEDAAREGPAQRFTRRHGFSYHEIAAVAEDRDGNLWLGSATGAMKVARGGFLTFDERDHVTIVNSLFESRRGELLAFGYALRDPARSRPQFARPPSVDYVGGIGRLDGNGFTWLLPSLPDVSWSDHDPILLTRSGEWWFGTIHSGVFVFPANAAFARLAGSSPTSVYTLPGQLAGATVLALYEDIDGDIWISTTARPGLARWDARTRTIRTLTGTPGLAVLDGALARAFQEDRAGNLWIGLSPGGVARYAGGRFTVFSADDGVPAGPINDLHLDREGRLWIGSSRGGLGRVDDPAVVHPLFVNYSVAEGLSGGEVTRIAEDLQGRIYAGTARGVDRLTPTTGRIRHFTTNDGLVPGRIRASFRDKSGALWFGTLQGLSRFVPEPDTPSRPPPIWIRGLRVAGEAVNVSALGETALALSDIPAEGNQLQIDFAALSFAPGETLRYQYKVGGVGEDWNAPIDQRTVHLAGLAPGRYVFTVRALNADGLVSTAPAEVRFRILAPLWRRPWFLALGAIAVGVVLSGAYRYRVSRLLELERVRTRIASDLHDDIGAALSRIAVLSEVARHEADDGTPAVSTRLSAIAEAAREVLDSMNDIVWAINPRHDQIHGLAHRMRRFAGDVFTARGIAFTFRAPEEERAPRMAADVRRHVFLIFKEAVNNIVRHSGATRAEVEMRTDGKRLALTIFDNGRGFDAAEVRDGTGLISMRDRARTLDGDLDIRSSAGTGTTVRVNVPLHARARDYNTRLQRTRQ